MMKKRTIYIGAIVFVAAVLGIAFWSMSYTNQKIAQFNSNARNEYNEIKTNDGYTIFTDDLVGYDMTYASSWIVLAHETSISIAAEEGKKSSLTIAKYTKDLLPEINMLVINAKYSENYSSVFDFEDVNVNSVADQIKEGYREVGMEIYDEKDLDHTRLNKPDLKGHEFKVMGNEIEWIIVVVDTEKIYKFTYTDNPKNFKKTFGSAIKIFDSLHIH